MIVRIAAAVLIGCALPGFAATIPKEAIEEDEVSPGQQWLTMHEKGTTPHYKQVAASVGEILLVQDENWGTGNGGLGVEMIFDRERLKIKKLAPKYRVMFFWSLAQHLSLDSYVHFSEEFYETMAEDCGKEMKKKLDTMIKTATASGEPDLVRAQHIRGNLELFLKK